MNCFLPSDECRCWWGCQHSQCSIIWTLPATQRPSRKRSAAGLQLRVRQTLWIGLFDMFRTHVALKPPVLIDELVPAVLPTAAALPETSWQMTRRHEGSETFTPGGGTQRRISTASAACSQVLSAVWRHNGHADSVLLRAILKPNVSPGARSRIFTAQLSSSCWRRRSSSSHNGQLLTKRNIFSTVRKFNKNTQRLPVFCFQHKSKIHKLLHLFKLSSHFVSWKINFHVLYWDFIWTEASA